MLEGHNRCFRCVIVLVYSDELMLILGCAACLDRLVAREVTIDATVGNC
jgi:hypothetical protein